MTGQRIEASSYRPTNDRAENRGQQLKTHQWQGREWRPAVIYPPMTGQRIEASSYRPTCDTLHVTHEIWHGTHGGRWIFSQKFSSLTLRVWEWRCFENIFRKGWPTDWLTESINHKGVCRAAPATPGLLKTLLSRKQKLQQSKAKIRWQGRE